jgi:hypothetical protein
MGGLNGFGDFNLVSLLGEDVAEARIWWIQGIYIYGYLCESGDSDHWAQLKDSTQKPVLDISHQHTLL